MVRERRGTDTTVTVDLASFREALEVEVERVREHIKGSRPRLLRVTVDAEVSVNWLLNLADGCLAGTCEYLWCQPVDDLYLAGYGKAAEITARGERRFDDIEQKMRACCDSHDSLRSEESLPPRWIGGYSFDPGRRGAPWETWPDARFVLPKWQFRAGRQQSVTFQALVNGDEGLNLFIDEAVAELQRVIRIPVADSKRTHGLRLGSLGDDRTRVETEGADAADVAYESWHEAVSSTAAEIRAGDYRKAVLARCETVALPSTLALSASVHYLIQTYPESVTFVIAHHNEAFMGASPERLVSVLDGRVHVDCLAGSTPRGTTPAEDETLGRNLLQSQKDLHEHAVVVDWVITSIADLVANVEVPPQPVLRKLANVQHLYTPVRGRLEAKGVLGLVERLHPTPAVAGDPRERALGVIAEREPLPRGWYAGAVGMVSGNGDGTFIVGLRSGLLTSEKAYLFAGGGIMGASVPEVEWQETKWKMRPMQAALQQSGGGYVRE